MNKNNKVIFAGVGPGAADLLTVRCLKAIQNADIIIYAGSLINPEVIDFASDSAEKHNSATMTLEEVITVIENGISIDKKVIRLHSGDPSIYGTLIEQFNKLDSIGIDYEVIPGVSSVFTSAAALKTQLTLPGVSQTIILTRRAGRTPVPEGQSLKELAAHKATMAIYLSVNNIEGVVEDLIEGGYEPDTAAAVVYRASWKDEQIVTGNLTNIAEKVIRAGITKQGMILIGNVLYKKGELSALYHESFTHGCRNAKNNNLPQYLVDYNKKVDIKDKTKSLFTGDVAIYTLTESGTVLGEKISVSDEQYSLFTSSKWTKLLKSQHSEIPVGKFKSIVEENWNKFDAHIFIMATGIVVRTIATFLKSKTTDPAVIVCDDIGKHTISLLSGHIGGANRLTRKVSEIINSDPVITTATDIRNILAIDELASINKWTIQNPESIKYINTLLIENKLIAVCTDNDSVFSLIQECSKSIKRVENIDNIRNSKFDGIILVDSNNIEIDKPVLYINSFMNRL